MYKFVVFTGGFGWDILRVDVGSKTKRIPIAALTWLERAHQAVPENRDFAYDLGRTLFALGRINDALTVLQPLSDRIKEDPDLALLLGRTHQALGRYNEAVTIYRDALALFGLQTQTLNEMGECHARLGDKAEALAAWKKSLEVDPNQAAIREKIAALEKKSPSARFDSRG